HGINNDELDLLVRPHHKDIAHCLIIGWSPAFTTAFETGRQHPVKFGNFQVSISNHGIVWRMPLRLLYVNCPTLVVSDGINAESDDLGIAFIELGLEFGHVAQFGRTYRREIFWMRKQYRP